MNQRLFVYGTLAPGRPNEHILEPLNGVWQPATVRGHLKEEGWGAVLGYPALVLDETGEVVSGFIFTAEKLSDYWNVLDTFEGEQYKRVLVEALLDDGNPVKAFVYVVNGR